MTKAKVQKIERLIFNDEIFETDDILEIKFKEYSVVKEVCGRFVSTHQIEMFDDCSLYETQIKIDSSEKYLSKTYDIYLNNIISIKKCEERNEV